MPQPLSRVRSDANVVLCNVGQYPLEDRPELLPLAMRVVSSWATLEHIVAGAFVSMLGSKAEPAVAIYLSLTSTNQQRTSIRAAAKSTLSDDYADLLEVLLGLFHTAGKNRNKIAHYGWGTSPEIEDAVLLAEPKALVEYNLQVKQVIDDSRRGGDRELPEIPTDKIYVYRSGDFEEAITQIENLSRYFVQFSQMLSIQRHRADEIYDQLSREPEIQAGLDRLRRRR